MGSRVKVQPPAKLPPTGLTPVTLKAWKSGLVVYLKQSVEYRRFLPGGIYATWTAAENNAHRITILKDSDRIAATVEGHAAQNATRLIERRVELETFLSIVANLCDTSDYEDILMNSISLDWIIKHIEQVTGI